MGLCHIILDYLVSLRRSFCQDNQRQSTKWRQKEWTIEASNHNTIKMLILNNFIFLNESWINFFFKKYVFNIFLSSSTSLLSSTKKNKYISNRQRHADESLTWHPELMFAILQIIKILIMHAFVLQKHLKWKNHIMTILYYVLIITVVLHIVVVYGFEFYRQMDFLLKSNGFWNLNNRSV